MKYLLLSIALLVSFESTVFADFICKEEASQRRGNSILSCGKGVSADEDKARVEAFDRAYSEFKKVCSVSSDCNGFEVNVVPTRTVCEKDKAGYVCYRLVSFDIGTKPNTSKEPQTYTYEQEQHFSKVYVGQTKKEFLSLFGKPSKVTQTDDFLLLFYEGSLCEYVTEQCYVSLIDGKISTISHFKSRHTESLK